MNFFKRSVRRLIEFNGLESVVEELTPSLTR